MASPRGTIARIDETELASVAARFGVSLDPQQVSALGRYWSELAVWTRRLNLVSSGDLPRLASRHIGDAFAVVEPLRARLPAVAASPDGGYLLDLGSGGGLPGIPVAIALRTWPVLLLERDRRRSNFLRACARALDTVPLRVLAEDAENLNLSPEALPVAIVTRAAFPVATLLRLCEKLLRPGGWLLAHRSPDDIDRVDSGSLHFETSLPYELPGESRRREIQIWQRRFT